MRSVRFMVQPPQAQWQRDLAKQMEEQQRALEERKAFDARCVLAMTAMRGARVPRPLLTAM